MEFLLFKSETEIKVIMVLIFWGVRWLYSHLTASDGLMSNKELEEEYNKATPPIKTMPMASKVAHIQPQATPLPQVGAASPALSPLTSSLAEERKVALDRKRKLFRNALLMHALMQRKDFIV